MTYQKTAPAIVVALFLAAVVFYGLGNVGTMATVIIGGSGGLAYIAWLLTTFKRPVDPERILPIYLILVAFELIHMAEEALMDFPGEFGQLFGEDFSIFAPMVLLAGGIWVLAGVGLLYKNPVANFFVWFVAIGPGIINAIAHFSFPWLVEGWYFPGLITVTLPLVASLVLIRKLLG